MNGQIIDLSRAPAPRSPTPHERTYEVCVIGSGYGGATAAWDLAEAGHEVVILEEGGDYTGEKLTQRDAAMYDQLYADRGGRTTDDLAISILQGRVLGGGGVINACDVVPISDAVLAHWRSLGLTDMTDAAIAPWTKRALEDLSASPIPEEDVNLANRLLRKGAQAIGVHGEVMHHNRVGCLGLGTCLIGCPADAKRNARFVAIPNAMSKGARVFIRARAVAIHDVDKEMKRIEVRTLDPKGYHEQGAFEIRARVVIVAGNPVNTAPLLLRSGIDDPQLGRHLSLQPQLPVMALFPDKIDAFEGIPQSYAITEHELHDEKVGFWGYRIEGIMGTPGIVASLEPYAGVRNKKMMTLYPRIAAALCLVPDAPDGTVRVGDSGWRPLVHYDHADDHKARARAAAKLAARIYLAAGATRVIVPVVPPVVVESEKDLARIDAMSLEPATAPWLSAHQQGGVRMAASTEDGAADPDGQVHGTKDVYVFDSSGFPTTSSSHTMTPIITMSHYLTHRLLARLH